MHVFHYSLTYKSPENQHILSKIVDEVRGLNPNYLTQHIRGMYVCMYVCIHSFTIFTN